MIIITYWEKINADLYSSVYVQCNGAEHNRSVIISNKNKTAYNAK